MQSYFIAGRKKTSSLSRIARRLGALGSCFAVAAAFAASEPSVITGQKKSYGYSWQQEMKLGADADKELVEEMGLYDDPQLQAYVQAVGQRVWENSHFNQANTPEIYRGTKFTFRVMDSPVVNAFALPGGYIYVTRGLLSHLQNEAQLSVVLGHEIAHVAARHASQQARRSQWGQIGVIAGAILGQKVLGERMPNVGETILGVGGQGMQMFMLRYSREAEHESDQLGVGWAARAGYAAGESAHFFESLKRLSTAEGKALPAWQSTHPDPGDRASRVGQIAAGAAPKEHANNVGEGEYLRHIENIVVGEDPRGGFAQDGVFYHPTMKFQMPVAQGWKMENQRAAVVMAEPNARAMLGLRVASGANPREAAMQFAQKSKVQITGSSDTVVNGLPATVLVGQAETEQGVVGVWNAFIQHEGQVFSVLGYAPKENFAQMRPTFEQVTGGFSPLRVPEVASIQPTRLRIVRADRNAPFASFVPASLPPELNAEHVAILNQVNLQDAVSEGRVLKVPESPARPRFTPAALQTPANVNQNRDYPYPTSAQGGYPDGRRDRQSSDSSHTYPNQPNSPVGNYPRNPRDYPPPQSYPPQSDYPPSAYPQNSYPNNYPSYPQHPSAYPGQQSYPPTPQSSYPQPSYPNYPPSSYPQPQPSYPPTSAQPQWPDGGPVPSSQEPQRPAQPQQGPVWPR